MNDRYSCEPIDQIWSEQSKLDRWVTVWGVVSKSVGHPFERPVNVHLLERAEMLEAQMGHDVAAAVQALTMATGNSYIHYGMCSSDVVDAGYLIGMRGSSVELARLSQSVFDALYGLNIQNEGEAVYRTHGQVAQVAPGWDRWIGYANTLSRTQAEMSMLLPRLWGLDGPTGTGSVFTDEQRSEISRTLGLSVMIAHTGRQAADRTSWATWLHSVASLSTVSERIATQIRLMAQESLGEVSEGRNDTYRASSSMPHKRANPTRSERICGMAAVIRGLANAYAESASSVWDSHSLEHSCADRILIPQITSLCGYVLTELADILRTLVVNDGQTGVNVFRHHEFSGEGREDSYHRRNRLIREGTDGDTWQAAR